MKLLWGRKKGEMNWSTFHLAPWDCGAVGIDGRVQFHERNHVNWIRTMGIFLLQNKNQNHVTFTEWDYEGVVFARDVAVVELLRGISCPMEMEEKWWNVNERDWGETSPISSHLIRLIPMEGVLPAIKWYYSSCERVEVSLMSLRETYEGLGRWKQRVRIWSNRIWWLILPCFV